MVKKMSKEELIQQIETEHRRLVNNLSSLNREVMTQPGVVGDWSIQDILAHLADWEQRFLSWYRAGLRGHSVHVPAEGMTWADLDKLNQHIWEKHRDRPLDEVWDLFEDSYQDVLKVVREMPEEDILTPGRFAWTGKAELLEYIVANTSAHYRWAKEYIRKWKAKQTV